MDQQTFDFPLVDTINKQAVELTHQRMQIVPAGRPDLAFEITLPKSWANDPSATAPAGDGADWTVLAAMAEKPAPNPPSAEPATIAFTLVTVMWRKLKFEVPLNEWAAMQIAALQVQMHSMKMWGDGRGPVIDVGGSAHGTLQRLEGGEPRSGIPVVLRAMLRCDAQDAFMVWGMSTPQDYPKVAGDLLIAGAYFALTRPVSPTGPEPLQRAAIVEPAVELLHPASWAFRPVNLPAPVPGKGGLDLLLIEDDALRGYVRVKAIDQRITQAKSMDALKQDATEEMASASVQLDKPWADDPDPILHNIPNLTAAFITTGTLAGNPSELHFGVVNRPPLLLCVTALAVPATVNAIACMRTRRAYGLALQTARAVAAG